MAIFLQFLKLSQLAFVVYLIAYASFLLVSLVTGGIHLHSKRERGQVGIARPQIPVSILVPAYNEEVTIIDTVRSLLNLDYDQYEIVVLDDGSKDQTAKLVREEFQLVDSDRKIEGPLESKPYKRVSETKVAGIPLTLIEKENGGKGDVLNLGINAARYDYFLCIDADSMLQEDSLTQIVQPLLTPGGEEVVAVGGLVQVAQGVHLRRGRVESYKLPWHLIPCTQAIEYDSSFLGSRIFMDYFQTNFIISGAFGLFKKNLVQAVGGYADKCLGEDMELVMKLHYFCRNNQIPYRVDYETNAVCWSQAPASLGDLCKQRRRWFLGLFQCLVKYRDMLCRKRFGLVGTLGYLYYLIFEFLSPYIEIGGLLVIGLSFYFHQLNLTFFLSLYSLYISYCALITFTSFLQRAYAQKVLISPLDFFKAFNMAIYRYLFLHWILTFVRASSLLTYRRNKGRWGVIKRQKQQAT